MKELMTAEAKAFVLEKLIPFINREQGRGFTMEHWKSDFRVGSVLEFDGVPRKIPDCGTVACIGGSIEVLRRNNYPDRSEASISETIGLNKGEGEGLFYYWELSEDDSRVEYQWPVSFQKKYANASTPRAKAKVACDLLRVVVKTNGECLKNPAYVAPQAGK